jgi:hypothetical protein
MFSRTTAFSVFRVSSYELYQRDLSHMDGNVVSDWPSAALGVLRDIHAFSYCGIFCFSCKLL